MYAGLWKAWAKTSTTCIYCFRFGCCFEVVFTYWWEIPTCLNEGWSPCKVHLTHLVLLFTYKKSRENLELLSETHLKWLKRNFHWGQLENTQFSLSYKYMFDNVEQWKQRYLQSIRYNIDIFINIWCYGLYWYEYYKWN